MTNKNAAKTAQVKANVKKKKKSEPSKRVTAKAPKKTKLIPVELPDELTQRESMILEEVSGVPVDNWEITLQTRGHKKLRFMFTLVMISLNRQEGVNMSFDAVVDANKYFLAINGVDAEEVESLENFSMGTSEEEE